MKTQGFILNISVKLSRELSSVILIEEYHTNKQGAEFALFHYSLKYGNDKIMGYSVNPMKNHLELKKLPELQLRDLSYDKIK